MLIPEACYRLLAGRAVFQVSGSPTYPLQLSRIPSVPCTGLPAHLHTARAVDYGICELPWHISARQHTATVDSCQS